jgi:hypothetical protein
MATFKYFTTCDGEQVQLAHVFHFGTYFDVVRGYTNGSDRAFAFHGTCPKCGEMHVAQRKIEWKRNPSLHKCNAKCMGGKVNGACECQCGGKNHGAGGFMSAGPFREAA